MLYLFWDMVLKFVLLIWVVLVLLNGCWLDGGLDLFARLLAGVVCYVTQYINAGGIVWFYVISFVVWVMLFGRRYVALGV